MEEELFQFEGIFGRPHPLLIPSIVQEVLEYLDFDHKKICREICKDWEKEAYKAIRGRNVIRITNYKRLKQYVKAFEYRKDFCNTFVLGRSLNIGAPLMVQFFNLFGPHIVKLSLEKTKWKNEQLDDVLFNKLTKLENLNLDCILLRGDDSGRYFQSETPRQLAKLKYLSIDMHTTVSNLEMHSAAKIKTFLTDFLSLTPNLEIISCPNRDPNHNHLEFLFPMDPVHVNHFINGEVLDALDELNGMGFESNVRRVLFDTLLGAEPTAPKLTRLGQLDVCMTLRDEHVRKLTIKSYPLRILDMVITQNVVLTTLHDLLTSAGPTLQSLTLRFLRRSLCTLEFPSAPALKNLRKLKMTGYKGSMQFVQNFPHLESLEIIKIVKLTTAFLPTDVLFPVPLQKMKVLEFLEVDKSNSAATRRALIQQWARNFPNLKKLRLDNISDVMLRGIYTEMPMLEELVARNGEFTDSGLTGFSPEKCAELIDQHERGKILEIPLVPEFPPLSSLKHLKSLQLGSKGMTDLGIIYGVAPCQDLTSLALVTYWMTDRSLQYISEVMKLESLKTEFCNQLTVETVKSVVEKTTDCSFSINEYQGPIRSAEMWKFLKRYNHVRVALTKLPDPVEDAPAPVDQVEAEQPEVEVEDEIN